MAAMRKSEQYYGARRHSLQGKKFKVACYVTYGRMACGTLSISEDGKVEIVIKRKSFGRKQRQPLNS